ncbi:DUF3040 domain-containing protein [Pseudarthrobacter phenanthrenivorans]|uniref:DUF3040 domain-containing protein n=1 Tax=Pseudarthrobacter phenanthrenivorans (strain DSM 18606 / JCM 16027 / LMG 23796 / Sphe3) TaxID=930171 RepID=F0M225_PSEPM|nr:DUF3040 domain-containing protein [Pseudarthrobacter phenanthrenivorans]ADX74228.1 hypothetical protein Asphe3_31190 [Pseudarthrobacter phenanthrenivorans Sphe3]TPV52515.1 DUF3040 domain-containing protein [Pseudarthrobacter phenanthrenivorans]
MALSEEERRRLEKLEQELASSDPDLYQRLQAGAPGRKQREAAAMAWGVLTLIAAFTVVIVGIATDLVIVGAVGFLLMIGGAHWFLKGYSLQHGHGETPQT